MQIDSIERSVNLPAEDLATVREEIGLLGRLETIGDKTSELLNGLKEKFLGLLLKKDNREASTKTGDTKQLNRGGVMESFTREKREIGNPVIEEARERWNQLMESRGLFQMSKVDFGTYFSSHEFDIRTDLKQQNIGDCYLVAAIHAMSQSPQFEMMVRDSMKKLSDGSWEVKMPLLNKDGKVVTIIPEEILPQQNKQFLRRGKAAEVMPDLRRKLAPVKAKEGLQVLEAAFIKQKFGSVDRLAAEGGYGEEALMAFGGDNFKEVHHPIFSEKHLKMVASAPEKTQAKVNEKKVELENFLRNFNPNVDIATANSNQKVSFTKKFKLFVPGHAYSILGVDSAKEVITLANPWNTSRPIKFTFGQFMEAFDDVTGVRIDNAKLLEKAEAPKKIQLCVALLLGRKTDCFIWSLPKFWKGAIVWIVLKRTL